MSLLEKLGASLRATTELTFALRDEVFVWKVRALTLAEQEASLEGHRPFITHSGYRRTLAVVAPPSNERDLPEEMTAAELASWRSAVDAVAESLEPSPTLPMKKPRLSQFIRRRDSALPRRLRLLRAKRRRRHPRWVAQIVRVRSATKSVDAFLGAFAKMRAEADTEITDPARLLKPR